MKNSISKFLSNVDAVFNPLVNYEGNFIFLADVLKECSVISKGKNLVSEYLEKNYYKYIRESFPKMIMIDNPPLYLVSDVAGEYGRNLKASLSMLINNFAQEIIGVSLEASEDIDELKEQVRTLSRQYRKEIAAIERGEVDTPERVSLKTLLEKEYERNESIRRRQKDSNYRFLSFEEFLNVKKQYLIDLSFGVKNLGPIFDKEIDFDELTSFLDLDKFFLAISKQLIEITKLIEKEDNTVHNSLCFVATYVETIKDLRKEGKYDLSVPTYTLEGKEITVSVDDIIGEFNDIKNRHQEFRIISLDKPEEDLRDINRAKKFSDELTDYFASKELEASWSFIRNGHLEDTDVELRDLSGIKKRLAKPKTKTYQKPSREELLQDTLDRIAFLDSTNYIYKMHGKNNFDGYEGYIYDNGCVVFEKFYRHTGSTIPSDENATYIMSFTNFVEMSKRTKTEIMGYIKKGATDLRRVYHTSTWCDRLSSIINGKVYNPEALEKIERLINNGELSKKK